MIAGVRARGHQDQSGKIYRGPRIDCAHAVTAAGPHGMLLAEKMSTALPQLSDMVMARTMHIDLTTKSIHNLRQVVMLGAGLDMRPFRDSFKELGLRYFEVDLPEMLGERERICREIPGWESVDRTPVAANFLTDDVATRLMDCERFDPALPTLFIYEGCSMYFDEQVNQRMIRSARSLMNNPDSRLWMDLVDRKAIDGSANEPAVEEFLRRMSDLGESFTYGISNPAEMLNRGGMSLEVAATTSDLFSHIGDSDKSVLDLYNFTVSSRKN
jgi:methyltransferase (TIGR00027 family)